MNIIDITISESDKASIFRLERLLRECVCTYEKTNTKDSIVYMIEFKTESIKDKFQTDWSL